MSLLHLAFEIFRITLLSLVYGLILWFILKTLFKNKDFTKMIVIPVVFGLFILWRFSFWRNNGLGDYGRVPLTSNYEVEMIDFATACITEDGDKKKYQYRIKELYYEDEILYGKLDSTYFIFNTDNGKVLDGLNQESFIFKNGNVNKLKSLDRFHSDYWSLEFLLLL